MAFSRAAALRSCFRATQARVTIARPQLYRQVTRRGYASGHESTKAGGDTVWALAAVGVTVPGCWYILSSGADTSHGHEGHGDSHGNSHNEKHEEEHEDKAESEEKPAEPEGKEDSEKSEDSDSDDEKGADTPDTSDDESEKGDEEKSEKPSEVDSQDKPKKKKE